MDPSTQPLGAFEPQLPQAVALLGGAAAVLLAAGLLELSRTLAERYKGRWFAGNGRDLFHGAAVTVLALALYGNGLPPALAALGAATVATPPLVLLDDLPARRGSRMILLLALVALFAAPALLEPVSIVDACNRLAAALFERR